MTDDSQTIALVNDAAAGNASAVSELFARYRERLLRMVAYRIDGRLQGRVDPADVVQEALIVASDRLADYAKRRPLPFYLWLRQITREQLVHAHEQHLQAEKRSVTRECDLGVSLSAWSRGELADCLASLTTPSKILMRRELRTQIERKLEQLPPQYREVLVQRFLEQLSVKEIGALLGISRGAAQMRIVRALEELRSCIDDRAVEGDLR